ncbi:DUF7504 family protein [Halopenitus persicus]|uniref:Uncharacterized protein n=1 Tax=Halopenitus persicus TaxID=1048396 RepID=A0A1H3HFQ6_9EURY|nr:hypothetical protein [Halopenitus persicus]SDY14160.1 hypothetical protein SAMN05216564_103255 [Halopenitus persicus]
MSADPDGTNAADPATAIDPGSAVLVLDGTTDAAAAPPFPDRPVVDPADAGVLLVSLAGAPRRCLGAWDRRVGTDPADGAILCTGPTATAVDGTESAFSVLAVSSPGALTPLGIRITERIDAWTDRGYRVDLQFDSITTLLQYVDVQRGYRFVNRITGHCAAVNATARFHLDPDAHDERTVSTFRGLFDAVVEHRDDGVRVRSR